MSEASAPAHRLEISRVIDLTRDVVRTNARSLAGLGLILGAGPQVLAGMLDALRLPFATAFAIIFLIGLIATPVLGGATVSIALAHVKGGRVQFVEAARIGLRLWPRLVLIGLTTGLLVGLGLVLLILPGLWAGVVWCVAQPAAVAEGLGVRQAMSRSSDLSKGHRWRLFAAFLLLLAFCFAVGLVAGFCGGFVNAFAPGLGPTITRILWGTASGMTIWPIFAVLYAELRRLKEGAVDTASVFD